MRAHLIFAIATIFLAAAPTMLPGARAAVTVLGGGLQEVCSKAARFASKGSMMPDTHAIDTCTLALDSSLMSDHDRAGTYVNRGVLYLTRNDFGDALKDFDTALLLAPLVGEAYVNRGAAL